MMKPQNWSLLRESPRIFEAKTAKNGVSEILLYDIIAENDNESGVFGGVSPKQFASALKNINGGSILLRINSHGGSVFGARAIMQLLYDKKLPVNVSIDGIAASAASFLAMVGDKITIARGGMLMLHKAMSFTFGNADDHQKSIALLEKIDASIVDTYATRTGMSADDIRDLMAAETYLTDAEAVEKRFVDEIYTPAAPEVADESGSEDNIAAAKSASNWRARQLQRLSMLAKGR